MLSTDDVLAVAQGIAQTMLHSDFEFQGGESQDFDRKSHLTGCVHITGKWVGAVVVDCSGSFAQRMSQQFIGKDEPTIDDVLDSVAELTNIIGGNVKSLLPGPSFLSLPSIAEGREHAFHVPGTHLVCELPLQLEGCPLAIAVLEEDERPGV